MSTLSETPNDIDGRIERVFDRPQSRSRRRWAIAVIAVAVVVIGALVATSTAGSTGTQRLRTAQAEVRDVDSELVSVATIEPVSQAAVAFPTSGTVATVGVVAGDRVTVGQELATLDLVSLTRALNEAKADLAEAELTLSRALDGEDVSDSSTSSSSAAQPASSTASTNSGVVLPATTQGSSSSSDEDSTLTELQRAVLDAQAAVDAAILASDAAMENALNVCSDDEDESADTSSTDDTSEVDAEAVDTDACLEALSQVQAAQTATAAAQRELVAASTALDDYLTASASQDSGQNKAGSTGSSGSAGSSGSSNGGSASAGGSSQSGTQSATSSPTSAELVAYQKAVSAAELQVLVAEQAVQQGTVVSPIDGTVLAVGFEVGDEVTAASATQTVIIEGDNGVEAVTTVSLSDVASVKVGQPATIMVDGSDEALEGEVVGVSATPATTGTTSYRVTVGLTETADIDAGTTGTVAILTGEARRALAVPSSAIRWNAGIATVQVVTDEGSQAVPVEVGVIGSDWVEIISGLDDGSEVVLADLDEALPGATSESEEQQGSTGSTGVASTGSGPMAPPGAGGGVGGPPGS